MIDKKWFDDWYLTIAKSNGPMAPDAYVEAELPHCEALRRTRIHGNPDEIKRLANLLDKLLNELTKTRKIEVKDGTDTALSA